jgi:hypothetical protein
MHVQFCNFTQIVVNVVFNYVINFFINLSKGCKNKIMYNLDFQLKKNSHMIEQCNNPRMHLMNK